MINSNVPVSHTSTRATNLLTFQALTGLANLNDDDIIYIAYSTKNKFYFFPCQVKEAIFKDKYFREFRELDCNVYFSPSTFIGESGGRKRENVKEIKAIVFDLDYGHEGHKDESYFINKEDALNWIIKNMPVATRINHTGGGFQIYYMLSESPCTETFLEIYKRIQHYYNNGGQYNIIDSCNGPEHLFRLPCSYNVKTSNHRLVEIVEKNNVEYKIDELLKKIVPDNYVECPKVKTTSKPHYPKVKTTKPPKSFKTIDRSELLYKKICIMLSKTGFLLSNPRILAKLKKDKELYPHYKNDSECLKDVGRIRLKLKAEKIKPVLPVEEIHIPENYDVSKYNGVRDKFKDIPQGFNTKNKDNKFKIDTTLAHIDKLVTDEQRGSGIIDLPCASGKTYSALLAIAERANKERRIWFVSSAIEQCKRSAKILKDLKVNAVAFHGRIEENCLEKDNKDFWRHKKQLCGKCKNKCGAELKYCQEDEKYDYKEADVVCCTHSNFLNAYESESIPCLDLIFIDESPNVFESFCFNNRSIRIMYSLIGYNETTKYAFQYEIEKIENILDDGGSRLIDPSALCHFEEEIKRVAFLRYEEGKISEIDKNFVMKFFNFFKRKKIYGLKTESEKIIYDEDTGRKVKRHSNLYSFMSATINLNLKCQTIILDGSARNQCVQWENFKIYKCTQMKVNYPNTTINCIYQNPTQTKLSKKEFHQELSDIGLSHIKPDDKVLIFSHKNMDNKQEMLKHFNDMKEAITAKGGEIIELTRSQNVGSNEGRECKHTIISVALFTTVCDYVLKASVVNDCEIGRDEIWREGTSKYGIKWKVLKFNKNNMWDNPLIQDQYERTLERDIYQTIMRGCIRDDSQAEYHATALIATPKILATLADDLPKAKFHLASNEVIDLLLKGYSEKEIVDETKLKQSTVAKQIKAYHDL